MKKAVFPGTFDPMTFGHIDIVKKGLKLFDRLIIAVAENPEKNTLFSLKERLSFIKRIFKGHSQVSVFPLQGLLIDFVKKHQATIILRGLRMASDFDYEMQMACMNYCMDTGIETVFLPPTAQHIYTASSLVRTIAFNQGNPAPFVPKIVLEALWKKAAKKTLA